MDRERERERDSDMKSQREREREPERERESEKGKGEKGGERGREGEKGEKGDRYERGGEREFWIVQVGRGRRLSTSGHTMWFQCPGRDVGWHGFKSQVSLQVLHVQCLCAYCPRWTAGRSTSQNYGFLTVGSSGV